MFLASLLRLAGFYPIRKLLGWRLRRQLRAFDRCTERPRQVQDELLLRILRSQQGTAFGRDHGFRTIASRDDFRRQVPVLRYEDLEPYIVRCRQGEFSALLAEPHVHMFAMTSGTTASRKYIPVTAQYLEDYRRSWSLWGLRVWQHHPEARLRPIVQLVGDWDEFRTEAGIPCGALTGLTAQNQKLVARLLYTVPWQIARIKDAQAKYYAVLRVSVPRRIGMLIAANPSTLVNLARAGNQEKEMLLRDIHNGTLNPRLPLPPEVRAALERKLRPDPGLARELEAVAERSGTFYPRDYWGSRKFVVGTWTGGSVGAYVREFPRYFGDAPVRDIGLIASEGRMTIPFADRTPSGVLDISSHYFEFVPEAEIDAANPTVLSADEVEEGKRYFILMTTAYGLYRYNIFDLVQITGFHHRTPLVEFLSKGSHFASVTGEKLSEYQVTKAMAELCRQHSLSLTAYTVAPCWDDDQPYYGLFVEASDLTGEAQGRQLAEQLDRRLCQVNTEYESKRESRRLGPMRLELVPRGFWLQWDKQRLAKTGGTLEQYKHPCLINDLQFRETVPVLQEIV
jgi:hypothetical protein